MRDQPGGPVELGAAPAFPESAGLPDLSERRTFAAATPRGGTLLLLVEGVPPEERVPLFEGIRAALERDRGTPSARLLRAVGAGCRRLESRALHRFELAALGLTALLIEDGAAYLSQLLPSQAYVVEDGQVKAVPEAPMGGAGRVASETGRRWEVEIDLSRYAARPGSAYVLCTAGLAARLAPARLLEAARRPAREAAASLAGNAGPLAIGEEILVARLSGAADPPRARLFPIRERRVSARPTPTPPASAGTRIEPWGLRGAGRPALRGRLGDPLPAISRPRRRRAALWLSLPAAVAGAAATAWALSRRRAAPPTGGVEAEAGPTIGTSASAPPGATSVGATLLTATEPFVSLAVANGTPRVLDAANRVTQPGTPPAPLGGAGQVLAIAAREGETLALDGGRTLWRLGEGGEAARPLPLRAASLWQRPRAIVVYAGNLYVLDAGVPGSGGQIWRHLAGAGGGFDGEAQAWLTPNAGVSLDGATGMAIDGAIWVSRADGAVLRLSAGRPEPFEPRGLDGPILSAGAIYTDRTLASVFVLDAAARRLVRLAKSGQTEASVPEIFPIGEHPRGLWVDEAGRRALILTDRRLQEVPLF